MSCPLVIRCVNCDGKGYVYETSWMTGMKMPKKCSGCGGTGSQKVRGA